SAEAAHVADVKLFCLPGIQTFFDLIREAVWIGSGTECFVGENRRRLVMAVSIAIGAREARNQHVRPELANDANYVGEWDIVPAPLLKGFFRRLRVAEVSNTGEALLDSVITI